MIEDIEYELLFIVIALLLAYGIYDTVGMALGTNIPVVAVTSGSMEPELQRGDLIIVHGKDFDEIELGDIIIYQSEYMPVPIIHRVIDRDNATVETEGDANNHQVTACVRPDGSYRMGSSCPNGELVNVEKGITEEQVLGTAFFIVPEVGHLKLVPTCIYLNMVGQAHSSVC